jgi:hypothetical protein
MRILSKIKKDYGDIKEILKNENMHVLDNIKSVAFNGPIFYILADKLYEFNIDTNELKRITLTYPLVDPKKIEYEDEGTGYRYLYILDDNNLYRYNLTNQQYNRIIDIDINQFTVNTDYIFYDNGTQLLKYAKTSNISDSTIVTTSGNTNYVDMIADNNALYLCNSTTLSKINYMNTAGIPTTIKSGLSNIKSLTYDGILLYLRLDNSNSNEYYKIFTKNGLEYTESKINNITGFQDIIYDGSFIYYRENNRIFRFDEEEKFFNYNVQNVEKIRYNDYLRDVTNEVICLKEGNLIISNGNHSDLFELNLPNIVDYSYSSNKKNIISDSNIFIITNITTEIPKKKLLDDATITSYYKDTNNLIYSSDRGIINHVYLLEDNNINSKIYENNIPLESLTYDDSSKTYYFMDGYKLIKLVNNPNLGEEKITTVIKNNSILNEAMYNKIKYDDGNIYLEETYPDNVKNTVYISAQSSVSNVLTLTTPVYNTYQDTTGNLFLLDAVKNIKKVNMNTDKVILNKNIRVNPMCMTDYKDNYIIGTTNNLRRYNNKFEELDSFTNPFFQGNIYESYVAVKVYNGNIFLCEKNYQNLIKLNTNNTNVVSFANIYPISLPGSIIAEPHDIEIFGSNLIVGCINEGYLIKYQINPSNIAYEKFVSLKDLLNSEITIENIQYVSSLNGILVVSSTGIFLVNTDLTQVIRTYDKWSDLKGIGYYKNHIYATELNDNDETELYKYSNTHYLTNDPLYPIALQPSIGDIIITNYNSPTKIVNNEKQVYLLDNNKLLYYDVDDVTNVYSIYNYNNVNVSTILDMVVNNDYLYVLKNNNTIDVMKENGYIVKKYINVDAKKITLPLPNGIIYYISNDNKIKYVNSSNAIVTVLENRGITVNEQYLYFFNNKVINSYNKNNTGITQLDENIYYSNKNNLLSLNNFGITEDLKINYNAIHGITNDTANLLVCTMNSLEKIQVSEVPIIKSTLSNIFNNPFKSILVGNFYYVSDTFNHRIIRFGKDNLMQPNAIIKGFNYPRGIDYRNGYLYVADCGMDKIKTINTNSLAVSDISHVIDGVIDFVFSNNNLYITSLLQNSVRRIDTTNNNQLSTYFEIEKPYYIDNNDDFLVSKDNSVSISVLSYGEVTSLINSTTGNLNVLIADNQSYNTNNNFKNWLDNEMRKASIEKNINKKLEMYQSLEQLLNTMNGSMDYYDSSSSGMRTDFEVFRNRMYLVIGSIIKTISLINKNSFKRS